MRVVAFAGVIRAQYECRLLAVKAESCFSLLIARETQFVSVKKSDVFTCCLVAPMLQRRNHISRAVELEAMPDKADAFNISITRPGRHRFSKSPKPLNDLLYKIEIARKRSIGKQAGPFFEREQPPLFNRELS